ncbi:unnamed protein product, partial [marine sediment metagenome]
MLAKRSVPSARASAGSPAMRRFRRNRLGIAGLILLAAILAACTLSLPYSTAGTPR